MFKVPWTAFHVHKSSKCPNSCRSNILKKSSQANKHYNVCHSNLQFNCYFFNDASYLLSRTTKFCFGYALDTYWPQPVGWDFYRLYVQIHASNVQVHLYHSTIILRYSFAVSDTKWRDQTRKHASSISFTWRLTTVHVKRWHVLTWGQAVQTKTHLHTCTSLFAELTCLKC